MTAKIIRRRREPSGSIIEAAYSPSQFPHLEAVNENRCPAASGISSEETEIIAHLVTGKKAAAVADLLEIGEVAVKEHINSILRKLKARITRSPSGKPVSK
ncbi:LuxR C-terminal-related transcriptional regulator [Microvirga guangxiensis]|uniref:Regulatory protein, luxR family n=1 Tax=Microvirga guangxiensis TaxID=549386 RepID=A0A1G5LL06_9HYPH|nr:LuxR C-terminal-related transcriptional regulator [Microvirga guangxiensis]SCZ12859.1 regulatory protein, luxR family [Microvirga guangxiensis]